MHAWEKRFELSSWCGVISPVPPKVNRGGETEGCVPLWRFMRSPVFPSESLTGHEPWRQPSLAASEPGFPAGRQDAALTGRLEARLYEPWFMGNRLFHPDLLTGHEP